MKNQGIKKTKMKQSFGSKAFDVFNYILMAVLVLTCILPVLHVLALSFSSKAAAGANQVLFWHKGYNICS